MVKKKFTGNTELCRHTKQPDKWDDYLKWRIEIIETHKQTQCPHCGAWKVWEKKK